MPKVPIKFVGQAYAMPAVQLDAQNCINWYPTVDQTGKFQTALMPRPGLETWSEDTAGYQVRGMFQLNDILYAVIDNTFYTIDGSGNRVSRGTLKSSVGNVRIIANDNQIFITDTFEGYVYQLIKNDNHDAGEFFIIDSASSQIADAVFTGSGIDDMTSGGTYIGTADKSYRIEIDSAGTPDTFRWSDAGGDTWNASGVQITGDNQILNDGVTVEFIHTDGHTLKDRWDFDASIESAFYVPIIPGYQDTYGIYAKQVSHRWYISELNDFSLVNALDFAQANAWPDNLVTVLSIREELWLICQETTEVWYNTGAAQFPFERRTNLLIKYGCHAPYSVAVGGNNAILWLARNEEGTRSVIMIDGYAPKVVSTEPLNAEFLDYETVDDAIGFVHEWDGHIFYTITFPTEDKTWVYDLNTAMWHQRTSTTTNDLPSSNETRQARWLPNCYSNFNGKHLVGDYQSGKIYKLSRDLYTDNGEYILCERTTRTEQENLNLLYINSLQIDFEAGKGLTTGQGSDPQAMLQVSRDGGRVWGNELWRSMGKIGKYTARAKWNRLGATRSFTLRLRITDSVYRVVIGAVADVEDSKS